MKQWYFIAISVAFLSFTTLFSLNDIINAFHSGDTDRINSYLDQSIEITVHGQNKSYTQAEAKAFIKSFFSTNKIKGFTVLHQSENKGSGYCIGNLATTGGNFRTTIYVKEKDGKSLIQEIRLAN